MAELVPLIRVRGETTSTTANVTSSATVVTLQSANPLRRFWTCYNLSDKDLYLKWGNNAALTDFSVIIPPNGYYEMPLPVFTGIITGISLSGPTGKIYVNELTE